MNVFDRCDFDFGLGETIEAADRRRIAVAGIKL